MDSLNSPPSPGPSTSYDPELVKRRRLEFEEPSTSEVGDGGVIPKPTFEVEDPSSRNTSFKINAKPKFSTAIQLIEQYLNDIPIGQGLGIEWFWKSQFAGFFNLDRELDMVFKPLCMLLNRLVKTNDKSEMWFCLNGVPIRYSLVEHALMTGLICSSYNTSENEDSSVDDDDDDEGFFGKILDRKCVLSLREILEMDVKSKLQWKNKKGKKKRKICGEYDATQKTKIAVLYFVCSVIVIPANDSSPIPEVIMKTVEDLDKAKKYPWGRLSFEELIHQVKNCNISSKLQCANPQVIIHCLIIPFMLFPLECIPALSGNVGRLRGNDWPTIPRMCKWTTQQKNNKSCPTFEDVVNSVLDGKEDKNVSDLLSKVFEDGDSSIKSILWPTTEEEATECITTLQPIPSSDATTTTWSRILAVEGGPPIVFDDIRELELRFRPTSKKKKVDGASTSTGDADLHLYKLITEMTVKVDALLTDNAENKAKVESLLKYNVENKAKVDSLLEDNVEVKAKVDSLKNLVSLLRRRFEEEVDDADDRVQGQENDGVLGVAREEEQGKQNDGEDASDEASDEADDDGQGNDAGEEEQVVNDGEDAKEHIGEEADNEESDANEEADNEESDANEEADATGQIVDEEEHGELEETGDLPAKEKIDEEADEEESDDDPSLPSLSSAIVVYKPRDHVPLPDIVPVPWQYVGDFEVKRKRMPTRKIVQLYGQTVTGNIKGQGKNKGKAIETTKQLSLVEKNHLEEWMKIGAPRSKNKERVISVHKLTNVSLTAGMLYDALRPRGLVSGSIIELYCGLLKDRELANPGMFYNCHFMSPYFYSQLTKGENGYDFPSVREWGSRSNIASLQDDADKVFIPIHHQHPTNHWTLAVISIVEKKFQFFDPLGMGFESAVPEIDGWSIMEKVARFFLDDAIFNSEKEDCDLSDWLYEQPDGIPLQRNGYDCGVFVMKYIDFMCSKENPGFPFEQSDMAFFRKRIACDLIMLHIGA